MGRTRLYIAGPMTGLPNYNLDNFRAAEAQLQAAGYGAVNPGRRGVIEGYTWVDYMKLGIADLLTCGAVATLPDWEMSRGASIEVSLAQDLEMDVRSLADWLELGD